MGERVKVNGQNVKITREPKTLYFVGGDGNIYKAKRGVKGKTLVQKTSLKREAGYLYYLDKEGYLARAPMGKKKQ